MRCILLLLLPLPTSLLPLAVTFSVISTFAVDVAAVVGVAVAASVVVAAAGFGVAVAYVVAAMSVAAAVGVVAVVPPVVAVAAVEFFFQQQHQLPNSPSGQPPRPPFLCPINWWQRFRRLLLLLLLVWVFGFCENQIFVVLCIKLFLQPLLAARTG